MEMLIGGAKVGASNNQTIDAVNPATGEVIDTFPSASKEDIERCLEIAQAGKEKWGSMSMDDRSKIMRRIPEVFRAHKDELAELLCRERV